MKYYVLIVISCLILGIGCKTEKKQTPTKVEKELSVLEKVANAHGYQHWKNVSEIKFTFNVDRDSTHFERSWAWKPKSNDVVFTTRKDTISYNRSAMDSIIAKTDRGFINDKFWLLGPYQLVWDRNGFTYEHQRDIEAPMSKTNMQKLTIVYNNEGGYTPGDAYDFYFEDDHIIKEWVFRRGNQPEPSMITSWEDYKDLKGLNIAIMHKMPESNFQLYFTGVEVKTE
ncbi:hypothetical protein [Maribacter sp. 2304DJ31-5]|uniref:hypothetical protein n=1 Tax=Maribacter sp. 2304DJ31-5 TaxID=3386273 RepID=UPI0039BCCC27